MLLKGFLQTFLLLLYNFFSCPSSLVLPHPPPYGPISRQVHPPRWTLLFLSSQHLLSCGGEQMAEHVVDLKYIRPVGDISALNMAELPPISSGGEDQFEDGGLRLRCIVARRPRRRHEARTEAEVVRVLSEVEIRSQVMELLAQIHFLAHSSSFSSRLRSQQETQSQLCCLFSVYTVYYIWSQNVRIV